MLERATACLKAGARESLKCTRQHQHQHQHPRKLSRTKRMLHQTFWTHGVGDLGLPPFAVVTLPYPTHLQSRHQCNRQHGDQWSTKSLEKQLQPVRPASADSPFLDFLYPPQALAWLQKASAQQHLERLERWEKRNARRLPEGFLQASRSYSSQSHAQRPNTESGSGHQTLSEDISAMKSTASTPDDGNAGASDVADKTSAGHMVEPLDETSLEKRASSKQSTKPVVSFGENIRSPRTDEMCFADSPGDLTETPPEIKEMDAYSVQPLHDLRSMLAGKQLQRGQNKILRAWALYNSLREDEKQDVRLKNELLAWLAARQDEVADAHCISLYWSLPVNARSLSTYQAVLSALLRRRDHDSALAVHLEALSNIPNGDQVTKALFRYAIQNEFWRLALKIKDQHHTNISNTGQAQQKAIFWLYVGEIPDIVTIAARFAQRCRKWEKLVRMKRSHSKVSRLVDLSARMSEEAITRLVQAPLPPADEIEASQLLSKTRVLCDALYKWSPEAAPKVFEHAILSLLQHHSGPSAQQKIHFARASHMVSHMYFLYRRLKDFKPSEFLLKSYLDQLLAQGVTPRRFRRGLRTITVPTLLRDWNATHGKLSLDALQSLMGFHAHAGHVHQLAETFQYLQQHYMLYTDQRESLWTLVYVHAQRADVASAIRTFGEVRRLANANHDSVDDKWWNILLHAHARADDIDGAFVTFKKMLEAGGKPTRHGFGPLLNLLAKRGDVHGVEDLLDQCDTLTGEPRHTQMVASHMLALLRADQIQEAEDLLRKTVAQRRSREVLGSLTQCFNVMLDGYAQRKNLAATMRVYRWMKTEKVNLNSASYEPLMHVFCSFRRSESALRIVTAVMPKEGLVVSAQHIAIVMAGLVKQGMYKKALEVHRMMRRRQIVSSLATDKVHLKAKAFSEQEEKRGRVSRSNERPVALDEVLTELRHLVRRGDGSGNTSTSSLDRYEHATQDVRAGELVASIMKLHGSRHCFEAVEEMFNLYNERRREQTDASGLVPMQILAAFMKSLFYAGRYDEVEKFWNLAKDQADMTTAPFSAPDFRRVQSPVKLNEVPDMNETVIDAAETGFAAGQDATQGMQTILPNADMTLEPRPALGRSHILTVAVRYYFRALLRQDRMLDLVKTWSRLLSQGYTFDNIAWNRVVEYLCSASPPFTLLAFKLTERFLIPNFPGWAKHTKLPARRSERAEGYQWIRARYNDEHRVLMPQYRTMLHLASAFVKLRVMETSGDAQLRRMNGAQRLIGAVKDIKKQAPKTLLHVQNMPRVNDRWQRRLLEQPDLLDYGTRNNS